jgi:hypothetical protein
MILDTNKQTKVIRIVPTTKLSWLTSKNHFLDLCLVEAFLGFIAPPFRMRLTGWGTSCSSSVKGLSSLNKSSTCVVVSLCLCEVTGASEVGVGTTTSGVGERAGTTTSGVWERRAWGDEGGNGELCWSSAEGCVGGTSEDWDAHAARAASCRSIATMSSSSEHSALLEWVSLAPFSLPNSFLHTNRH